MMYSQKDLLLRYNLPEHLGVIRKARRSGIPAIMDLKWFFLTDFIVNLRVASTIVSTTKENSSIKKSASALLIHAWAETTLLRY